MKTNIILKITASAILLMAALTGQAQDIRYVRPNGTGDGSSWANASGDLQAMIEEFGYQEAGQVWVAAGTYVPSKRFEDDSYTQSVERDRAFIIDRGSAVQLFGGFPPSGNPTMADRDWRQHKTILDGKANEPSHPLGALGGAFHVLIVWTGESPIVDGFHITGGNANQIESIHNFPRSEGGGAILSSNIIFRNNEVYGNAAVKGGGVRINASGGNYDLFFQNNKIYNNTAINHGGGIYGVFSGGRTLMSNNLLHSNAAAEGGHNSYFQVSWDAELTLINNTFYYGISAAGLYYTANYISFGDGMYENNKVFMGNNIFINKSDFGPVFEFERGSGSGSIEIDYCMIYGEFSIVPDVTIGENNIIPNSYPMNLFIHEQSGDFHLKSACACVDVGNNDYVEDILYDLDENARIFNEVVDLGAYEYTVAPFNGKRIYVGLFPMTGDDTGRDWNNPCRSFSRALDIARENPKIEEIWVREGEYTPALAIAQTDNNGQPTTAKDYAFVLPKDVKIYGGFSGGEEYLEQRVYSANSCILIGLRENHKSRKLDTMYHVVIAAGDVGSACLDGFDIVGGKADGQGSITVNGEIIERNHAGGIYLKNSSPVLSNIVIRRCSATCGGAISNDNASLQLANASLYNNKAHIGGAIHNNQSSILMTNVTITENSALEGGAVYNSDCSMALSRNTVVWGNKNWDGEPDNILNVDTNPEYVYCLIEGINPEGEGNLNGEGDNNNPRFENIEEGIFRPQAGSPIIDSGNPAYFAPGMSPDLSGIKHDVLGNSRFSNGKIDMGAYQNLFSDVTLLNIWVDNQFVKPVAGIDTLYRASLYQYKEKFEIRADLLHSGAVVSGDHGMVSCVEGLNIYNLKVTSENGVCHQWHRIEVTVPKKPDGIESEEKSLFTCYPNPTNGKLHISSKMEIERIIIYNQLGQSIIETSFNGQSIDMQNYPSGIYLLKAVTRNGKTGTQKVIKR